MKYSLGISSQTTPQTSNRAGQLDWNVDHWDQEPLTLRKRRYFKFACEVNEDFLEK